VGLFKRDVEVHDKPIEIVDKSKYYKEWLKSHKRITLYFTESEFKRLKEIIGNKDLKSGILDILEHYEQRYNEGFEKGFSEGKDCWALFIKNPVEFYNRVMSFAYSLGLNQFEPLLFVKRCPVCGKPMVFTHDNTRIREIRQIIREAFREWKHPTCH